MRTGMRSASGADRALGAARARSAGRCGARLQRPLFGRVARLVLPQGALAAPELLRHAPERLVEGEVRLGALPVAVEVQVPPGMDPDGAAEPALPRAGEGDGHILHAAEVLRRGARDLLGGVGLEAFAEVQLVAGHRDARSLGGIGVAWRFHAACPLERLRSGAAGEPTPIPPRRSPSSEPSGTSARPGPVSVAAREP